MVAEFEADLIRARTREGMAVAKAKGRLRGKQPKPSKTQEAHLVSVHHAGTHTTVELAELFAVARSTVHRAIKHAQATPHDAFVSGHSLRSAAWASTPCAPPLAAVACAIFVLLKYTDAFFPEQDHVFVAHRPITSSQSARHQCLSVVCGEPPPAVAACRCRLPLPPAVADGWTAFGPGLRPVSRSGLRPPRCPVPPFDMCTEVPTLSSLAGRSHPCDIARLTMRARFDSGPHTALAEARRVRPAPTCARQKQFPSGFSRAQVDAGTHLTACTQCPRHLRLFGSPPVSTQWAQPGFVCGCHWVLTAASTRASHEQPDEVSRRRNGKHIVRAARARVICPTPG
jgi:hypothetical protein